MRRLLSAAGAAAILLTLGVGGAVLPAAAEENEYVLLIDDFLANGEALKGLMDICRQAECHPVGAGICIEKCFQPGGETLRGMGLKVVSLAAVEKTENGEIRFLGEE